jgi:hypothetical protein
MKKAGKQFPAFSLCCNYLFLRIIRRKTGSHFCWNRCNSGSFRQLSSQFRMQFCKPLEPALQFRTAAFPAIAKAQIEIAER